MLQELTEYDRAPTGGRFLLYTCESFTELEMLQPSSANFALLTAFDLVPVASEEMWRIAKILVERGLAYACCWGADSERWHDAIDDIDIERVEARAGDYRDVVMTTWHNDEPFEETLEFFEYNALPVDEYVAGCRDYIIAVSPQREADVKRHFALAV